MVLLALTVQLKAPPPELEITNAWLAGRVPPCPPVKVKAVGLNPIVGVAFIVNETVTVCGVLVAPVAAIVIGAL